ncbi:MAG: hypothetical protein QXS21_04890 [Thermoproteota archaeon]
MEKGFYRFHKRKGFSLVYVLLLATVVVIFMSLIFSFYGALVDNIDSVDRFYRILLTTSSYGERLNAGLIRLGTQGSPVVLGVNLNGVSGVLTATKDPDQIAGANMSIDFGDWVVSLKSTGLYFDNLYTYSVSLTRK